MTNRLGSLERAGMRSSVMPSLKYAWSRSPLMLVSGNTALEGMSGNAGATSSARGVDAVAVDLLAIHHHVAEIDSDAKLHLPLGWQIRVLGLDGRLNFDGALDRIDDAGELGKYAVARGIDEAPAMRLDQRIDQLAMRGQSAERRLFVLPHEAAIAED